MSMKVSDTPINTSLNSSSELIRSHHKDSHWQSYMTHFSNQSVDSWIHQVEAVIMKCFIIILQFLMAEKNVSNWLSNKLQVPPSLRSSVSEAWIEAKYMTQKSWLHGNSLTYVKVVLEGSKLQYACTRLSTASRKGKVWWHKGLGSV